MTTVTDSISIQAAKEHPLPELTPGQTVGGLFEVLDKLDEGLLGAVYRVKHTKTGQVVALKIIRPSLLSESMTLDRFSSAISGIKTVKHPDVVEIYDSGEHDGVFFFTMEFVENATSLRSVLNEYRASGKEMPRNEMLDILTGLLKLLDELHPGNLHRNLKPENILILKSKTPDGKVTRRIRLTDMAIARVVSLADSGMDREGAWYLAPEMSEFGDKANPSSDLYSVGAIFYEMMTGFPPVGRYEMPSAILEGGVSELVDDLVEISLAPNPQDRFNTADDMLAALEETFSDYYGAAQVNMTRTLVLLGILTLVSVFAIFYFKNAELTPEEQQAIEDARIAEVRAAVKASPVGPAASGTKDGMVWIPSGQYVAGKWSAGEWDFDTAQGRDEQIIEVGGFWIDVYEAHSAAKEIAEDDDEATIAEKTGWNEQWAGTLDVDRTWVEAKGLCEQQGKRLCTEDEWEKACRGSDNADYTYGSTYEPKRCPESGYSRNQPYRADMHPACKSDYGIFNLGGGATEWTTTATSGGNYVVKPGGVGDDAKGTRCSGRTDRSANFAQIHVGYRCCAD
ncbi:MAG: protein kinase [Proteobacteria bacterium]|nr:protein kinase [Pseudomonadota bacterium]